MELIIIGLFVIFFSYMLLDSLYNSFFKCSMIEGLEKETDKSDDNKSKDDKSKDDKSKGDDSDTAKAEKASAMSSDGNQKIAEQNKKHPNATYNSGTSLVQNPNNP